jgi:hypothetical protein
LDHDDQPATEKAIKTPSSVMVTNSSISVKPLSRRGFDIDTRLVEDSAEIARPMR